MGATAVDKPFPKAIDFAQERDRALASVAELIQRAKKSGQPRPDFVLDDLVLALMANSGIRAPSHATAVAASPSY